MAPTKTQIPDQKQPVVLQYGANRRPRGLRWALRICSIVVVLILICYPKTQYRMLSRREAIAFSSQFMTTSNWSGIMFHIETRVVSLGWPFPWISVIGTEKRMTWQLRSDGLIQFGSLLAMVTLTELLLRWTKLSAPPA